MCIKIHTNMTNNKVRKRANYRNKDEKLKDFVQIKILKNEGKDWESITEILNHQRETNTNIRTYQQEYYRSNKRLKEYNFNLEFIIFLERTSWIIDHLEQAWVESKQGRKVKTVETGKDGKQKITIKQFENSGRVEYLKTLFDVLKQRLQYIQANTTKDNDTSGMTVTDKDYYDLADSLIAQEDLEKRWNENNEEMEHIKKLLKEKGINYDNYKKNKMPPKVG